MHSTTSSGQVTLSAAKGRASTNPPGVTKILPRRVCPLDQRDLSPPRPTFELPLPLYGIARLSGGFHVHETCRGMAEDVAIRVAALPMLDQPSYQVVRDANVELAGVARENVDVERAGHRQACGTGVNVMASDLMAPSLRPG